MVARGSKKNKQASSKQGSSEALGAAFSGAPRGLHNLHNSCFFNAALQFLNQIRPLSSPSSQLVQTNNSPEDKQLLSILRATFDALRDESTQRLFAPKDLFDYICSRYSAFERGMQGDAHEVITLLLDDCIHATNLHFGQKYGTYEDDPASIINTYRLAKASRLQGMQSALQAPLEYEEVSITECPCCRHQSVSFQAGISASIPLPDSKLKQEHEARRESLDGAEGPDELSKVSVYIIPPRLLLDKDYSLVKKYEFDTGDISPSLIESEAYHSLGMLDEQKETLCGSADRKVPVQARYALAYMSIELECTSLQRACRLIRDFNTLKESVIDMPASASAATVAAAADPGSGSALPAPSASSVAADPGADVQAEATSGYSQTPDTTQDHSNQTDENTGPDTADPLLSGVQGGDAGLSGSEDSDGIDYDRMAGLMRMNKKYFGTSHCMLVSAVKRSVLRNDFAVKADAAPGDMDGLFETVIVDLRFEPMAKIFEQLRISPYLNFQDESLTVPVLLPRSYTAEFYTSEAFMPVLRALLTNQVFPLMHNFVYNEYIAHLERTRCYTPSYSLKTTVDGLKNLKVVLDLRQDFVAKIQHISNISFSFFDALDDATRRKLSYHKPILLEDCFATHCAQTRVDGWRCPKCRQEEYGLHCNKIWSTSEYLVLHLKRFEESFGKLDCFGLQGEAFLKRDDNIKYPLVGLDLSKFVHEDALANGISAPTARYDLAAAVFHYGSANYGHYVAAVRGTGGAGGAGGPWWLCDDDRIRQLSDGDIVNPAGYILLYKKRETAC